MASGCDRQLTHSEWNEIRAAYNDAKHLPERRTTLQAPGGYLDGLKAAGKRLEVTNRGDVKATRVSMMG